MYEDVTIPMPSVDLAQADQDPHSERILKCIDLWGKTLSKEDILKARRAYYGACTYIDDQVGGLLQTLKDCHLGQNTLVVFSGDHGDMLGERGLWYKMSWLENSARVPFIFHFPQRFQPRRVKESISTMDLGPTLAEIVGSNFFSDGVLDFDGKSFYRALIGQPVNDEVLGEYMGEGSISPVVMIRRGRYKYIYCRKDPSQLFDLELDPQELNNLAFSDDPKYKILLAAFQREVEEKRWHNLDDITRDVLKSQRQRRKIHRANIKGKISHWDFQPTEVASQQ